MKANYSLWLSSGQRCILIPYYRKFFAAAASQSLRSHRPSSLAHHRISSRCLSPHLYRHHASATIYNPSYTLLLNYRGFHIRAFSTTPATTPPTSPTTDKDDATEPSSRKRNWRIAKELGRHVWPSLSPEAADDERNHVLAMKQRVVVSVGLNNIYYFWLTHRQKHFEI